MNILIKYKNLDEQGYPFRPTENAMLDLVFSKMAEVYSYEFFKQYFDGDYRYLEYQSETNNYKYTEDFTNWLDKVKWVEYEIRSNLQT